MGRELEPRPRGGPHSTPSAISIGRGCAGPLLAPRPWIPPVIRDTLKEVYRQRHGCTDPASNPELPSI